MQLIYMSLSIRSALPFTLLLLLSFSGFAYSQINEDLLWQREETKDPSGIAVSVDVGMRAGVPLELKYRLVNENEVPATVWLVLVGDGVATNITISQAGKTYRSIHQYGAHELPRLKPVSLLPDQTLEWEYQIVDLVDNPEEFARIENFERFGITLRLPYMIVEGTENSDVTSNRRGLTVRWRWNNKED